MTLISLIGLAVIAVVVFLFVIEPILRAKSDVATLDAVALPHQPDPRDIDDDTLDSLGDDDTPEHQGRQPNQPVAVSARRASTDTA